MWRALVQIASRWRSPILNQFRNFLVIFVLDPSLGPVAQRFDICTCIEQDADRSGVAIPDRPP
jgi:hypothetical protein